MPTPESIALSRDRFLIHAVAVAVSISSEQAIQLLYWQPELVNRLNSGQLPPKHEEIARTLVQTTADYLSKKGSRPPPRKKVQIDRQLVEEEDTSDYSQMEGGALQLTTGPPAAQLWFQDLNPQLQEFLSRPHPAISA
ncbi:hypothetical protein M408DRAFT_333164 [Serendipita vermifera MAFF 305830]|uniref:Uncharacterized protein n=1 Tax=Serendipita vermifera MAFF 305830 TaxID=933852 RepID=A0A0C3ABC8_SERVB|nr:hypothetical protein M408DRAFT_333164 [Serendipita vermifera MAFF 305830]